LISKGIIKEKEEEASKCHKCKQTDRKQRDTNQMERIHWKSEQ